MQKKSSKMEKKSRKQINIVKTETFNRLMLSDNYFKSTHLQQNT